MAVEVLAVPDEAPPTPATSRSWGAVYGGAVGARGAVGERKSFLNVFKQMEVLHRELLEAYEMEIERSGLPDMRKLTKPEAPAQKAKSKSHSAASFQFPGQAPEPESDGFVASSERRSSLGSEGPNAGEISSKLVKKTRHRTTNMDCQIKADSMASELQLREEWDLPEQKVLDLKRLQRRMSVGNVAGLQQATLKRRYLVRSIREDLPWYIMHPSSAKRLFWDCLAVFMIIFETAISPLHLYRMDQSFQVAAETVQWVATGFWFLDIVASFLTAVYVNDVLRHRLKDIAVNYLKSWCVFDVLMLASDFLSLLWSETDLQAGVLRVARAKRLIRLFRLLRLFQIIRLWKVLQGFASIQNQLALFRARFGSMTQPVITLGFVLLFSVHILGSLWFAVGDTEEGWVRERGLHQTSLTNQYIRSLEWAVAKLPPSSLKFTVELNTAPERWLGIFGTCMALLTGSLFISILTNTMAEVARERARTTKILESVRRYCSSYSISYAYTRQMKRYVEREHRRNEIQNHMTFLQTLPVGMVQELFQEARSQTLHAHAFFKELGLSDPGMELNLCSQVVSEVYYLSGDIIFDTTSKVEGMYQIAAGQGIYFFWFQGEEEVPINPKLQGLFPAKHEKGAVPMTQTLVETQGYIAEAALWVKAWRHQGQFQASMESRALLISTEQLLTVLQSYANCLANAVIYARLFVKELNKTAHLSKYVTDLPLARLRTGKAKTRSGSLTDLFKVKRTAPEKGAVGNAG